MMRKWDSFISLLLFKALLGNTYVNDAGDLKKKKEWPVHFHCVNIHVLFFVSGNKSIL